jgi:murein DD-endopeptidase MepM/ murein hydrolase activator NlpD
MKKIITAFLLISLCLISQNVDAQKDNIYKENVRKQKMSDAQRVKDISAKMKSILNDYNKKLRDSGVIADLAVPIDEKNIEEILNTTDFHAKEKEASVSAYVKNGTAIFDNPDHSREISECDQSELVEVIEKTSDKDVYMGKDGRWFLVRKSNGDEGWIHSSFLSKNKPDKESLKKEKDFLEFDTPVPGRRTSDFGSRIDPVTKKKNAFHSGIDIAAPKGTPVKASEGGVITFASFHKGGYGNLVIIEHTKGFATYYGHLSRIDVAQNQNVKKGSVIGAVGSTGKSTGPHLHFEIRRGDQAVNPDSLIH